MEIDSPQNSIKSKRRQLLLGLVTNLSNLAPGITLGFSAILLPVLLKPGPEQVTVEQGSWIASAATIAMPIGSLISGPVLDRFGRKNAIYLVNILSIIGWTIIAATPSDPAWMYAILLLGRVITGAATGMASVPATVYLSEISTPKLRAMLATWTSVFIAIGVFVIYLLGLTFKDNWRLCASISVVIPICAFILMYIFMPESPQWLISKNRLYEAEQALSKIWQVNSSLPQIRDEIERLMSKKLETPTRSKSFARKIRRTLAYFKQPQCYKPFVIMALYFLFQQFSGTFVVVFYAVAIVQDAGVTFDPYLSAVTIAAARVIGSVLVGPICRKFGRRPPSLFSGVSISICLLLLATHAYLVSSDAYGNFKTKLNFLPVVLLVIYFFTSTIGFLTIPFAMVAEMYPTKIRGLAGGLTACFCYTYNFVAVKTYPEMVMSMGDFGVYIFYGVVAICGTIFVAIWLPETKGKTLQEIEEYFTKGTSEERTLVESQRLRPIYNEPSSNGKV